MKVLKWLMGIILIPYMLVAMFVTVCLLNYNDYKITEIGDYSFIIVNDDNFNSNYNKGDLLVVKKNNDKDINKGDSIFFYDIRDSKNVVVTMTQVKSREDYSSTESTYVMNGDYTLTSSNVIGKVDTAIRYKGMGSVLKILESKWGFLGIFILPILVLFLYEIYIIIYEIVHPEED